MNLKKLPIKLRWVEVVIVSLVLVGVVITLLDYRDWQKAEKDKYGQGWADLRLPASELAVQYQNITAGIRMKIPQEWKVVEGRDFVDNKKNWSQLGLGLTGKKVADIGGLMSINLIASDQSLVDKVDTGKKKYKAVGYESLREGEQLNTGGIDISLLFWKKELPGGGAGVIYEALFKKEQRIFVLTSEVPLVDSPKYEKTFYAIYESIVLF